MNIRTAMLAIIIATSVTAPCSVQSAETKLASLRLADLSLEELMEYSITSVSKQQEPMFNAAAAIHVITRDDIRRSGVTSLPEALRLAPGVQVSRIDGNKWAIGIRGFASRFSNKLLVLLDGRTLYNSTFSGVYWDAHEIMLEDVDRIEVIRGSGSTLWGANAVNGVINIITLPAQETRGGLVTATAGSWERGAAAIRYGIDSGRNGHLRWYGKYFYRDAMTPLSGVDYEGFSNDWRSGFRGDWRLTGDDTLTFQGDGFDGRYGSGLYRGYNLLGRWEHRYSDTSELSLKMYWDHNQSRKRIDSYPGYTEKTDRFDAEFQHSFMPHQRHRIVWGAGIRVNSDALSTGQTNNPVFVPAYTTEHLFSGFVQDVIAVVPEKLAVTIGTRAEHLDTTGWQLQPTARFSYTPNDRHTIWGAVSRAVRTPSRAETAISALVGFIPPATEVRLTGNRTIQPESLISYDAGYRFAPMETLYMDAALFYNEYRHIIGSTIGTPTATLVPFVSAATTAGHSTGGELTLFWRPLDVIKLTAAYSYLEMSFASNSPSTLDTAMNNTGTAPRHQASLRTGFDLPHHIALDFWIRYGGAIRTLGVDEFVTADARIAWQWRDSLEISLAGQNLIDAGHTEHGPDMFGNQPVKVPRSVYGKLAWRF